MPSNKEDYQQLLLRLRVLIISRYSGKSKVNLQYERGPDYGHLRKLALWNWSISNNLKTLFSLLEVLRLCSTTI